MTDRVPYVEGRDMVDRCLRSAQIDREEADTLPLWDLRRVGLYDSAAQWEEQARRAGGGSDLAARALLAGELAELLDQMASDQDARPWDQSLLREAARRVRRAVADPLDGPAGNA